MAASLIIRIPYNLAVLAIKAAAWCSFPRISLLVVAGLALILEALRVEADVWVVAVGIVQPYLVVDYQPRLLVAYLAQPAVQCDPVVDVGLPCALPCLAPIELLLGQHRPQSFGL